VSSTNPTEPRSDGARRTLWPWLVGAFVLAFAGTLAALNPGRTSAIVSRLPGFRVAHSRPLGQLEPLPASQLLRSYPMKINGEPSTFSHYLSPLPARQVVERFTEQAQKRERSKPGRNSPEPIRLHRKGYSMMSTLSASDGAAFVIAFDLPRDRGSMYMMTQPPDRPNRPASGPNEDVPGRDVPGVPRPPFARRVLCLDGIGGVPSMIVFYEGGGNEAEIQKHYIQKMTASGWTFAEEVATLFSEQIQHQVLSFHRGQASCLILFEREAKSWRLDTSIFYIVRDWMPPAKGF